MKKRTNLFMLLISLSISSCEFKCTAHNFDDEPTPEQAFMEVMKKGEDSYVLSRFGTYVFCKIPKEWTYTIYQELQFARFLKSCDKETSLEKCIEMRYNILPLNDTIDAPSVVDMNRELLLADSTVDIEVVHNNFKLDEKTGYKILFKSNDKSVKPIDGVILVVPTSKSVFELFIVSNALTNDFDNVWMEEIMPILESISFK